MMQFWATVSEWLPWLGVALLAGLANFFVAWQELTENCRYLPFFRPLSILGVWVWIFGQFSLPALAFWLLGGISNQTSVTVLLCLKAFGYGLGFVAIVNSRTSVWKSTAIDIKTLYSFVVRIAYQMIAASQTLRTAQYRADLRSELLSLENLEAAIQFTKDYIEADISLDSRQKRLRVTELNTLAEEGDPARQVDGLISLLEIRRKDLAATLQRFGCSEGFLHQYFGKR